MRACIPGLWLVISLCLLGGFSGCQDDRVYGAGPRVGGYHVGDTQQPPGIGDLVALPGSAEIDIDFGLVDVATSARRYLFLRNTGKSDLKLSKIRFLSGFSADFVLACWEQGLFVAGCPCSSDDPVKAEPGADLVVEIAYAPADVGADQGSFELTMNVAEIPLLKVNLNGEGVTPEIQVCVTDCVGDQLDPGCAGAAQVCNDQVQPENLKLMFGDADLATSLSRKLWVRNQGDRPLQIAEPGFVGGDFTQFAIGPGGFTLPGTLAVGEEAELVVVYHPAVGGEHQTQLKLASNDVDEREIRVLLGGRGMAPRLCPDPMLLDFGNVPTGETATRDLRVTSCGLLELALERVELSAGSSQDFRLTGSLQLPRTLAPGEFLDLQVEYAPQDRGTDHGGVSLFSNDPSSDPASHLTGTVSLQGESVPRACDIQATPSMVNFGAAVMNTGATMDLIVSNQGNDICTLERVEITQNTADSEFSVVDAPALGYTFAPGDTTVVRLEYRPVNIGKDSGVLSLFGNDKDTNQILVNLSGEGVETAVCDVEITPSPLSFGLVRLYNTKSMVLQLTNRGLQACQLTGVQLDLIPIFGQDFRITAQPNLPQTLNPRGQPGSQAEIEISFFPQRQWLQVATMVIKVDDPDLGDVACRDNNNLPIPGEACISVMGYSRQSEIEVVPSELDFGVVTLGCDSPERCVTVYNLGSTAVSVDAVYLENPADSNFEIIAAPLTPFSLVGGGSFQVCLRYHPQDLSAHRSVLYLEVYGDQTTLSVPLFGRGTDIADQADIFHQADQVRADVLFVVDCSGSMGDDQESLASNFDAFINWAFTLDVDFHIGVVTTQVEDVPSFTGTPPRRVYPGELVEVTGRPKIITNQTPDMLNAFKDLVRLGSDCSNTECGLEAAWMALSEPLVSDPLKNAGFLREDAKLYLIAISDEPDQSKGSVDFYVDFYRSLKGYRNFEMMTFSAICIDCSTERYYLVADATEGICENIATADWHQALYNLGFDAFSAIREFPLSRPADPATITVKVAGAVVPQASSAGAPDGWTYYPDTNTIFFGDNYVPNRGDRIEVNYTATCL